MLEKSWLIENDVRIAGSQRADSNTEHAFYKTGERRSSPQKIAVEQANSKTR